jgi:hypothetical protein
MSIESYVNQVEPQADAIIWRFIDMPKFRDLMANEELFFFRADLYKNDDPFECLPSDDYVRQAQGLVKYDLHDELKLNHSQAVNRQHSESYFISCWQLFEGETLAMWKRYGGIAICSQYKLLKSVLNVMPDKIYLGLVQYGEVERYNSFEFIFHKRILFEKEREVRAALECFDPVAGQNRHFDLNNFPNREPIDENPINDWVHKFKRRRIDLRDLITEIMIGPWITDRGIEEVNLWLKNKGFSFPIKRSVLASSLTPTVDDLDDNNIKRIISG